MRRGRIRNGGSDAASADAAAAAAAAVVSVDAREAPGWTQNAEVGRGEDVVIIMHGRSRMTIDGGCIHCHAWP